jgi:negative elongation factor B
MKNMDIVEDKYLKQLVADKSLYEKCDVTVKRQIWQEHQSLFGDEVSPILSQYIKEVKLN